VIVHPLIRLVDFPRSLDPFLPSSLAATAIVIAVMNDSHDNNETHVTLTRARKRTAMQPASAVMCMRVTSRRVLLLLVALFIVQSLFACAAASPPFPPLVEVGPYRVSDPPSTHHLNALGQWCTAVTTLITVLE
jgi:hypothetical protein